MLPTSGPELVGGSQPKAPMEVQIRPARNGSLEKSSQKTDFPWVFRKDVKAPSAKRRQRCSLRCRPFFPRA